MQRGDVARSLQRQLVGTCGHAEVGEEAVAQKSPHRGDLPRVQMATQQVPCALAVEDARQEHGEEVAHLGGRHAGVVRALWRRQQIHQDALDLCFTLSPP
eukprot:scaffold1220_cov259-Pinguiococcus_pyrenoidosus.AAC.64